MSVPFVAAVAVGAVEVATDPGLVALGVRASGAALASRFPDQHPLLVGEHLDYATMLVRAAAAAAAAVQAGTVSRGGALAALQHSHPGFAPESVERALAYGLAHGLASRLAVARPPGQPQRS